MKRIVRILMARDGLSRQEAKNLVQEVQEMIAESCYNPMELEDLMYTELGLEMDYLFDLV